MTSTWRREPVRMVVSWLYSIYCCGFLDLDIPFVRGLDLDKTALLVEVIQRGDMLTSSAGRLFDAVSAVPGTGFSLPV